MSSLSDDEDDHLFSKLELNDIESGGDITRDILMDSDSEVVFIGVKPVAGKSNAVVKGDAVGKEREDWKCYVSWFESQQIFDTPWFQTIPVSGLNFTQCKSVMVSCKDWGHLEQLAKLVLAFFKEARDAGDETTRVNMLQLIEILFTRVENELMDSCSTESSQRDGLNSIFEEMMQCYISDYNSMQSTSIPNLLVKLYPDTLERILSEAIKSNNAQYLVPICSNNPTTFQEIMESLSLDDLYENDPDFQNRASPKQELANSLVSLLKEKLGAAYFRVLPTALQPVFSFDAVASRKASLRINDHVITEVLDMLNNLFSNCDLDCDEELEFIQFMLKLLPFTWSILTNKKSMKQVMFKNHPHLYLYAKRVSF